MSRIEKRVVVNYRLERLFVYHSETDQSQKLWSGLLELGEVQRLPWGGVVTRWIYQKAGLSCEGQMAGYESQADRDSSLAVLGNVECVLKWTFYPNIRASSLTLSGDYIYWSLC